MPTSSEVRTALISMLQSINGVLPYNMNLTSSTFSGMEPATGRPAGQIAYVWRGRASISRDPDATLAGWIVERVHALTIYNPPSSQDNADRETALDIIESDILNAVDQALGSGGALANVYVLDVTNIEIVPRFASQPGSQAQPSAVDVLLTLRYLRGR
jgi:hypothetical protein